MPVQLSFSAGRGDALERSGVSAARGEAGGNQVALGELQVGCVVEVRKAGAELVGEGAHRLKAEVPRAAGGAVVVLVHDVVGREDLEHPREVARAPDRDRCPRQLLVPLQGHLSPPSPR